MTTQLESVVLHDRQRLAAEIDGKLLALGRALRHAEETTGELGYEARAAWIMVHKRVVMPEILLFVQSIDERVHNWREAFNPYETRATKDYDRAERARQWLEEFHAVVDAQESSDAEQAVLLTMALIRKRYESKPEKTKRETEEEEFWKTVVEPCQKAVDELRSALFALVDYDRAQYPAELQ